MRCSEKTCEGRRCKNPTFSFGYCVSHTSCSICLDRIQNGSKIKKIRCGHAFHEECINPHLTANYKCPVCRELARDLKVKTHYANNVVTENNIHRVRELILQMYNNNTLPGNLEVVVIPYGEDIMVVPA